MLAVLRKSGRLTNVAGSLIEYVILIIIYSLFIVSFY
jgi:hypothetical protein